MKKRKCHKTLSQVESEAILCALQACCYNLNDTCKMLDVPKIFLMKKILVYKVPIPEKMN